MTYDQSEADHKRRMEAREAIRALTSYVNSYSADLKFLVEELSREHRTLQQCVTGFMLAWLNHLASLQNSYDWDLRNEASVKIAKAIKKAVPDIEYRLPLI